MTDGGNRFPLLSGGGREKGAGGAEQDVVPPALPHPVEQIAGQNHGGTAASGAAAVDVLLFQIVNHGAAVVIIGQLNTVLVEEIQNDFPAQFPQVAGDDEIIERGLPPGILKMGGQGGVGRRGRSQGCTMWKMFSVKFNAYSSPEARRF